MANTLRTAALQKQFESVLGDPLDWQCRPVHELVRTGISEVDSATGGLPRGCLTEIIGPASSGRTSLLVSILAEATARGEVCALVDAEDCFDPSSAAKAGVCLERLIWIRSAHNAEHALKAADLLIQGGGFGLVIMDLGDTPLVTARRISLTSWFRLRRAVEHTPTVLVTLARQANAKTCASLILECKRERAAWSGIPKARALVFPVLPSPVESRQQLGDIVPGCPSYLLHGIGVRVTSKNRSNLCSPAFTALAI